MSNFKSHPDTVTIEDARALIERLHQGDCELKRVRVLHQPVNPNAQPHYGEHWGLYRRGVFIGYVFRIGQSVSLRIRWVPNSQPGEIEEL